MSALLLQGQLLFADIAAKLADTVIGAGARTLIYWTMVFIPAILDLAEVRITSEDARF